MIDVAHAEAEKAVQGIAAALGKEVSPALVEALANAFVGVFAAATGIALKRAARAGQDAANSIVTPADVLKELAE